MVAIFNFQSLLVVILLFICTCTYIRGSYPSLLEVRDKHSFSGLPRKAAIIGERLSPWVSACCLIMGLWTLYN
ncbi:TMEM167 family protein [Dictyostelium discoideum AX4]|uniref:Protein kish n=1 Tax=Dictyostelium discoideum TaxID=44689 RepID=KISH_DICDI|nr:TMEM167 family protein [Dictyostelium discoideum AX4]Q54HH9.1 RecName: Full=Protein kish; AltName: Full=Transmembrane protein 167; Flags: Precursor [Dictyostelium discoideum]EAL62705.1 TMEM167 family protein [Dictyostelium discoideum AX4]|eukprot:XP_636206.1 TMEM167 family protein [Dictyostelium discoideum AX4]